MQNPLFWAGILLASSVWLNAADDWPAHRGDSTRAGYFAEFPDPPLQRIWVHQSPHPPEPAWTPPARGSYWQRLTSIEPRVADDRAYGVIAVGDRVYYGSSADDQVYCLNAETGAVLWTYTSDGPVRFAPVFANDRIFFGSDDGSVYCLDADQGDLIWKRLLAPTVRRIPGNNRVISAWPIRTGLVVDGETVYALAGLFATQGVYAYALNSIDGEIHWRTTLDHSPQGYLLASHKRLYVPTGRSTPIALDRSTGEVVKTYQGVGGTFAVVADQELIAGPGINGTLTVSDRESRLRLVSFKGRQIAVTPRMSYLLEDGSVTAIERRRYVALIRKTRELDQRIKELKARLKAPPKQSAEAAEIHRQIDVVAAELDRTKQEIPDCQQWKKQGLADRCIIGGEEFVVAGGDGQVAVLQAKDGKLAWSDQIEGVALVLAATKDRLLVSTDGGTLYAYAPAAVTKPEPIHAPTAMPPATPKAAACRAAAEQIMQATEARHGFALMLGVGSGRLAYELARRSNMQILAIDGDASRVQTARAALQRAGYYGRITVHHVPDSSSLPFTDYFANLIVSETAWLEDEPVDWSRSELRRVLRPYGGVLWLRSKDHHFTRGPLEQAGEWTHQYGNTANTSSSGDKLIDRHLRLQWFGGPGPDVMVDRHLRAPAPLFATGRMLVPGENSWIGLDAYNGAELWRLALPNSQRYSMPYDAGYMSTAGDLACVAVQDACWLINAASGEVRKKIPVPSSAGQDRHWGYAALVEGRLFGSAQKSTASRMDASYDRVNADYANNQPVVTSEAVFAVDATTGVVQWIHRNGVIVNPTLTIAGGRVYFVEGRSDAAMNHDTGRMPLETVLAAESYLVALNAQSGELDWEHPVDAGLQLCHNILYMTYAEEMLVAVGSQRDQQNETLYRIGAYDASTGIEIWQAEHAKQRPGAFTHGEQVHHPVMLNGQLLAEPALYELQTGKRLSPEEDGQPWVLRRPGHSCGTLSAAGTCLFFRAGNPTLLDLGADLKQQTRTQKLASNRPGCWINIIPAGGLVLIPEASASCVCSYSLQTSMAFLPGKDPVVLLDPK